MSHCSNKINTSFRNMGGKEELYDAELHAIQVGLRRVATKGLTPTKILICVDNQSALTCLTTGNPAIRNTPGMRCGPSGSSQPRARK